MLTPVVATRPPADSTTFGYPAAALVIQFQNESNVIHWIYGSGDASDAPGSLYANAPNGSIYIPLTTTAGNYKIYVKEGAKGLKNGTWVATGALT